MIKPDISSVAGVNVSVLLFCVCTLVRWLPVCLYVRVHVGLRARVSS